MTLSIYLGIFSWCPNCSWWLIPLLLGAWFLGWLFYRWTKGSQLKTEVNGLHGDIKNWKKKFTETESDLTQAKFDREKISGEYATLKSKFTDSDNRYRALEGKYKQLESTGISGSGSDVDTSKWENNIADLESQLETSRNTNLKLQDDYASLKSKFADMQTQLASSNDNDYESGGAIVEEHLQAIKEQQTRIAELEKELALSNEANTSLEANYANLKTNYADMELNLHGGGGASGSVEDFSAERETLQSRITDLEKKLASSYETNTKMEADYAQLKSNYGDLEMNLHGAGDVGEAAEDFSVERESFQARITELELMLASQPTEDKSEPGEGKKKKKKSKKKKKNKNKKGKGKKENEEKSKQGSGGQSSGYALAFADDNLQIVEGIGPKIESVLKAEGVNTWKELSQTSTTRLREIMVTAGSRYKMHDPSSWAKQAEFASKNNWNKLVEFQKELGGAKGKETDSKAEKLYFKAIGFANVKQNDHKVIEGIGPKIEGLLKEGGIKTWKKLSESKVADIQKILDEAGPRYKLANPGTWAKQAKMAANGDWTGLKNYQDKLKGGKE